MDWITSPEAWIALATLTVLEIVLGIDNIIFISILVGRLPAEQRQRARVIGLGLAMVTRIALLMALAWMMRLTAPLFQVAGTEITGRTIILVGGGLFLLAKSVMEIHNSLEGADDEGGAGPARAGFAGTLVQIAIIDLVFSLDSVITAVGMADRLWVMVAAVVFAMIIMIIASNPLADFVAAHPTVKMLALSFLLLIGVLLIADGFGLHIPKGYVYFALAFSVAVEALNHWVRRRRKRLPAG